MTDRQRLAGQGTEVDTQRRCLLAQVAFAIEAGLDAVQIRERDLEAAVLFDLTVEAMTLAKGSRTRILVNDRVDVALAAGADGVHLRRTSIDPAAVRQLAPRGFLVGQSVHSAAEASAAGDSVDYLIAGTVWATPSKSQGHALLGLDGLADVVSAAQVPVLGIGGVSFERASAVVSTGARGIAAIGLFMRRASATDTMGGCGAVPLHDLTQRLRASVPPLPML